MSKSPGHQKWPYHKVEEQHLVQPMMVEINGETIAESNDVVRVKEDDHPDRYYFPRTDVRMNHLEQTTSITECPFKGEAHYFNLKTGGRIIKDAIWTYETPYDEHRMLKDRLAFYDDKIPEIHIRAA